MRPLLESLQHQGFAHAIANSLYLTAVLSATHLLGFTLLMGSAVIGNLRLAGLLLPNLPVAEVAGPTRRAMAFGLAISVTTGFLLFSTRAAAASENGFFQLKMLLLLSASVVHFGWQLRVIDRDTAARRVAGVVGLMMWLGVALSACAFILLE